MSAGLSDRACSERFASVESIFGRSSGEGLNRATDGSGSPWREPVETRADAFDGQEMVLLTRQVRRSSRPRLETASWDEVVTASPMSDK